MTTHTHTHAGIHTNGIQPILVEGSVLHVYCDMTHNGGGWTLIAQIGCPSGRGDEASGCTSNSNFDMPTCSSYVPVTDWSFVSDAANEPDTGSENYMSCEHVNAIRESSGIAGASPGYWMTTPGDSDAIGGAMGGAQTFGRHDCVFRWKRPRTSTDTELSLLGSNCRFVQWEYEDAESGEWEEGDYWNDSNAENYQTFMAQGAQGQCYKNGQGLNLHGSFGFHRGWCGAGRSNGGAYAWGLVFVR